MKGEACVGKEWAGLKAAVSVDPTALRCVGTERDLLAADPHCYVIIWQVQGQHLNKGTRDMLISSLGWSAARYRRADYYAAITLAHVQTTKYGTLLSRPCLTGSNTPAILRLADRLLGYALENSSAGQFWSYYIFRSGELKIFWKDTLYCQHVPILFPSMNFLLYRCLN